MRRMAKTQAVAEWGDRLHVASLAALAKSDDNFRILHDGTHSVRVNPKIKVRDQTRMPAISEKKKILSIVADQPGTRFALKGDASKAHRRVRVLREDWGAQACQLDDEEEIWLNAVGTFGISSAGKNI